MSRHENLVNDQEITLAGAIGKEIRYYCHKNKTLSSDRDKDIQNIKGILLDDSIVDIKKYFAIKKYIQLMHVGLLGRSMLRDCILKALKLISLENLADELLRHRAAKIRDLEMRIHALQPPLESNAPQQLLLDSKNSEILELKERNKNLSVKAEELLSTNDELITKYKVLKNKYILLCKRHHEQYAVSLETLSQHSLNDIPEEDGEILSTSVGSNRQRLFKLPVHSIGTQTVDKFENKV